MQLDPRILCTKLLIDLCCNRVPFRFEANKFIMIASVIGAIVYEMLFIIYMIICIVGLITFMKRKYFIIEINQMKE